MAKTNFTELIGRTFGRLTVIADLGIAAGRHNILCRCACGKEKAIEQYNVTHGLIRSCRCLQAEINATTRLTHGYSRRGRVFTEYRIWKAMIERCSNPHNQAYADYGGRGISVCARWHDFVWFLVDVGPRPGPGFSINRIDNDQGYDPGNVIWSTRKEQARNKRNNRALTIGAETHCVSEWAEMYNLPSSVVGDRVRSGWPLSRIFIPLKGVAHFRRLA